MMSNVGGNNNRSDDSEKWSVMQTFEQLHSDDAGKLQRCQNCRDAIPALWSETLWTKWLPMLRGLILVTGTRRAPAKII